MEVRKDFFVKGRNMNTTYSVEMRLLFFQERIFGQNVEHKKKARNIWLQLEMKQTYINTSTDTCEDICVCIVFFCPAKQMTDGKGNAPQMLQQVQISELWSELYLGSVR